MGLRSVKGVDEVGGGGEMDDFTLGMIAAEGCFYVGVTKQRDYEHNIRPHVKFSLSMVEEQIVQHMKQETGLGRLKQKHTQQEGHRDQVAWSIQSASECREMARLLDGHIGEGHPFKRTRKYKAYNSWKSALNIISSGKHLTEQGIIEMVRIRDRTNINSGQNHSVTMENVREIINGGG